MAVERVRIVFPKGTKVGLVRGTWSMDAKGNIIAYLTPRSIALAKFTNERMTKKAREEAREMLLKLGGI